MSEVLSQRPRWPRVSHPVGAVKTVAELREEDEAGHDLWGVLSSGSWGPVFIRDIEESSERTVEFYDERDELQSEVRETHFIRFTLDERDGEGPVRRSRSSASFNLDGWIATKSFFFRREEYAQRYVKAMKEIGAF